jgi:kynurenine formamidase
MGYDPSILPFLRQRDVALIGSDVAQDGGNIEGIQQPIHAFVLLALGMNILDNLALDELGDTAARLKRWDFMLVVAPLRVEHGSGSPVNPVALF